MGFFVAIAIIGAIFAFFLYHVVTNLIYICSPNEVLVFSGGRYITGQVLHVNGGWYTTIA